MRPSSASLEAIAAALHPVLGDKVRDGTADVSAYPVPGLPDDVIWRVRVEDLDHPVQVYMGVWPDGSARVLSDDQPAFLDLVTASGVRIGDPDTALGYALAFLEVTRGPTVSVRALADAATIPWRPGSPDEEARRDAFLAASPVRPATAEATGDRFRVEMWLMVDQRIQLNSFVVAGDGALDSEFRVVAADLPLPIAR